MKPGYMSAEALFAGRKVTVKGEASRILYLCSVNYKTGYALQIPGCARMILLSSA